MQNLVFLKEPHQNKLLVQLINQTWKKWEILGIRRKTYNIEKIKIIKRRDYTQIYFVT